MQDALTSYGQALQLDPDCAICRLRMDRIHAELHAAITASMDAGQRYHGELRVDEAVVCWERVLLLSPDPDSFAHIQALGYLDQVQQR
jgi:hypothetical protein